MNNEKIIEQACLQMQAYLNSEGFAVTSSQMRKALEHGFGTNSAENTGSEMGAVKPSLPASAVPANKKIWPYMQQWIVSAVYLDNDQQFGESYWARTALEAAYLALMDRQADGGLDIGIISVADSKRVVRLSPSVITEISLVENRTALATLLQEAGEFSWDRKASRRELLQEICAKHWLQAVLKKFPDSTGLPELNSAFDLGRCEGVSAAVEGQDLLPAQALSLLCDGVLEYMPGAADQKILKQVYQLKALCVYFEDVLNAKLSHSELS